MDIGPIDPMLIVNAVLGFAVIVGGIVTGMQSLQAKRSARQAAQSAYPLSNGWGSKVTSDLDYLRNGLDRVHARMDENDHRQTQQDARDAANEVRTDRLEAAFYAHLMDSENRRAQV